MSWAEAFLDWTEATFEPFGVIGILVALFLIAYAESSFFPIPPDLLILAFVLNWPELFWAFAIVATVGSVLGGLFGYWIGERGGRPMLARLSKPERIKAMETYFDKWGSWAVGISGFGPIPYKIFTITAGALKMDKQSFLEASALSRGARFGIEATLLYAFREPIKDFMLGPYFNLATLLGILGLVGVLWGRSRLAARRSEAFEPASEPAPGDDPDLEHPPDGKGKGPDPLTALCNADVDGGVDGVDVDGGGDQDDRSGDEPDTETEADIDTQSEVYSLK